MDQSIQRASFVTLVVEHLGVDLDVSFLVPNVVGAIAFISGEEISLIGGGVLTFIT